MDPRSNSSIEPLRYSHAIQRVNHNLTDRNVNTHRATAGVANATSVNGQDAPKNNPDDRPFRSNKELKSALETCLEDVKDAKPFAARICITNANPGLTISGLGRFGVPLADRDVKVLLDDGTKVPNGDNIHEIDGARISLSHPEWQQHLQKALNRLCSQLGIPKGAKDVHLKLHKMFIHQPGGMSCGNPLTSKTTLSVGTIAITLPCIHTGGESILSFNGDREIYESAIHSEWSTSVLAWYSDVLIEVSPVLSGYRVVLIYDLVYTGSEPLPDLLVRKTKLLSLTSNLRRWNRSTHEIKTLTSQLVFLLERRYTQTPLHFDRLEGNDRSRFDALSAAARNAGFVLYLCQVLASEWGEMCYDFGGEIIDVEGRSIELTSIFSTTGKSVRSDVVIDPDKAVNRYDIREPDETGRKEDTDLAEHVYLNTGILILPEAGLTRWLVETGTKEDIKKLLSSDIKAVVQADSISNPIPRYTEILQRWLNVARQLENMDLAEMIIKLALSYNVFDVAVQAIRLLERDEKFGRRWETIRKRIVEAISKRCFDEILPLLETALMLEVVHSPRKTLEDELKQLQGVCAMYAPRTSKDREALATWKLGKVVELVDRIEIARSEDLSTLINLLSKFSTSELMLRSLQALLNRSATRIYFILRLEQQLTVHCLKNELSEIIASSSFHETARALLRRIKISEPPQKSSQMERGLIPWHEQLKQLYDCFKTPGYDDLLREFIDKVEVESLAGSESILLSTVLPFLECSIPHAQTWQSSAMLDSDAALKNLFPAVLERYISGYVRTQPREATTWIHPIERRSVDRHYVGRHSGEKVCCSCQDCNQLYKFLGSDAQTGRIYLVAQSRAHMAEVLDRYSSQSSKPLFDAELVPTSSSTFLLKITKTKRCIKWDIRQWEARKCIARTAMSKLTGDEDRLKALLGKEYYNITHFRKLERPSKAEAECSKVTVQGEPNERMTTTIDSIVPVPRISPEQSKVSLPSRSTVSPASDLTRTPLSPIVNLQQSGAASANQDENKKRKLFDPLSTPAQMKMRKVNQKAVKSEVDIQDILDTL